MRKKKFSNFADFVLNDDKIVMKLLLTIAKWFGAIIFTFLAYILYSIKYYEAAIIISIFAIFGWYGVLKFYKLGGSKNLSGLTASKIVWNKDKIMFKNGNSRNRKSFK